MREYVYSIMTIEGVNFSFGKRDKCSPDRAYLDSGSYVHRNTTLTHFPLDPDFYLSPVKVSLPLEFVQ